MKSRRLPRFHRAPPATFLHLTARDCDIIRLVHRHRFLRSQQILALVGGSPQALLRRLQLLYHHGYLERPRCQLDYYHQGGSRQIVYGLGNKGGYLLKREGDSASPRIAWGPKNRAVGRLYFEHALLVSEVMVAIELACRRYGCRLLTGEQLSLSREQPSLRWQVEINGGIKLGLIPDWGFALEQDGDRCFFFLEADRGTMPVLRKNLAQTSLYRKLLAYQWKDRKLIIQPEEAAIRRKAYELFLQCRRKGQVARFLNTAGYRTRGGAIWRDTTILRILDESSAKGVYVFNTLRYTGNWRTEPKPESEWGKVACEPIVSEELWNQVNQIIEEQLKSWKKPGKPPVHLFSGLAHCSCGQKMYVAANNPKYFCRKCCNKIPIVDLENVIQEELKAFFGQTERIVNHLQAANQNLTEKSALLETHQKEVQKVRDEMKHTHRLYLDGQITAQGFGDFYKPAEARLNQLLAELPKLEAEVDFMKVNKLSADDVLREANSLHEQWPKLPTAAKRKIIEALIEKIVIGNGEIDITFSHLASSEELCKNQQKLGPG